jgi:uncharacterized protein
MIIDFHTHFFPDKIAKESIAKLAEHADVKYFGDGTLKGLLKFMMRDGIDLSLNQPVATRPEQVVSINRKMLEIEEDNYQIMCFAAMHPDFKDCDTELSFLASKFIRGIKMHPDYQDFHPGDKRMIPIYESLVKNEMMLLLHSGVDLAYTEVHSTPREIKEILKLKGLTLILAHMGGYRLWDDVEKYLVGENVYFDLAYCDEMKDDQLKRMILDHGSDKILFGTDFPWERGLTILNKLYSLHLSKQDLDNIIYKNALRLLKI